MYHILVVDDDPAIRDVLTRYFSKEGLTVTPAPDGRHMFEALAGGGIDLVVLDLMMPGEDGLDLAKEIRKTSDIPIIILTGKGDEVDRIIGLEIGADDYMAKPFNPREVLARIKAVMRRVEATRLTAPSAPWPISTAGPSTWGRGSWWTRTARRSTSPPGSSTCWRPWWSIPSG